LTVAVQQPDGHDEPLHVQTPELQTCPVPVHVEHTAPPVPQLVVADWLAYGTQVAPLPVPVQQPDGHDDPLHVQTPELQTCPFPVHVVHTAPPAPQLVVADWLA
jgi:hypothetical protein